MKRTQVQLDEQTYEQLRRTAYQRKTSVARVIREAVAEYLVEGQTRERRSLTMEDFPFINTGRSGAREPGTPDWGDVIYEEMREKAEELRRAEAEHSA